jgi:hypothetical protein
MIEFNEQITMMHDRALTECERTSSLTTSFHADTVAVGTMFTVKTHNDPISILTMEISANPVNITGMDVEIYTKVGNFTGFENNATAWQLVTKTNVIPAREGRGTLIPEDSFIPVNMTAGELRSFYVTLKTSDLRYTRAKDISDGEPFSTDGYLSVNVGVGLSEYHFSKSLFKGRLFNGIFHYTHLTNCDEPIEMVVIPLKFSVRPQTEVRIADVIDQFNDLVKGSLQIILDTIMVDMKDKHSLKIDNVQSKSITDAKGLFGLILR